MMKNNVWSKVFPLFLATILLGIGYHYKKKKARVLSCHDGDTCQAFRQNGEKIRIRFYGIDAPEVSGREEKMVGQPYGAEAREYLKAAIEGQWVTLEEQGRDPYDRVLAEVYLGSRLINLELVKEGLAHTYKSWRDGRNSVALYLAAEREARLSQRGLWSQKEVTLPGDFRRRHPRLRRARRFRREGAFAF